jgi:geranylgeranyl pyrophosphate synthase
MSGPITPSEVPALAEDLKSEGAYDYTQNMADRLTDSALNALEQAKPIGDAGLALKQLTQLLLRRKI